MRNKIFLKKILLTVLLINCFSIAAQNKNLYAGIEVGSKGVKMTVLDVDNIKRGKYEIKDFWTENIGISKGISVDGKLAKNDITAAVNSVKANYLKIKNEYGVLDENIFLVGSSGVAMASNTDELVTEIKLKINKTLNFIDANQEAKMLLKGSIPPVDYRESMVLDIGGGNTKGGFVEFVDSEDGKLVFFPVNFNYGTVTLTEEILEYQKSSLTTLDYHELQFSYLPKLRKQVKEMYNSEPRALTKENIYMSGGAVWAFYTLYMDSNPKKNFNSFSIKDVLMYDALIKNNFDRFEALAKKDKKVATVLKVYSQEYLISASNLFLVCLEDIPNIKDKNLYFSKQGQIAWLVSYVVEKSNRIKDKWKF
ncbi:Ppx/GppA phosphatase family protein [Neotamlana laminarinivorans]|uniref:Exopolyphosphatase n=1 Tax=Neotamlana laminarinivorans TaxID=2883124 RepID=A0A9X1HYC0_9FLAO|nr:exopolyphosphatase [Tamlana laminarinivorans]MCB4798379.1 exopolyphosphatase [Tamlana laminarinivorans]